MPHATGHGVRLLERGLLSIHLRCHRFDGKRGDFTCGGRMSLLGHDLQLAAGWPSGFDGSADDGYFLTSLDVLAAVGVIPIQRLGRHDD